MSLETDRGSRLDADAGDGEPPAEDGLLVPREAESAPTVSVVLPTLDDELGAVDSRNLFTDGAEGPT